MKNLACVALVMSGLMSAAWCNPLDDSEAFSGLRVVKITARVREYSGPQNAIRFSPSGVLLDKSPEGSTIHASLEFISQLNDEMTLQIERQRAAHQKIAPLVYAFIADAYAQRRLVAFVVSDRKQFPRVDKTSFARFVTRWNALTQEEQTVWSLKHSAWENHGKRLKGKTIPELREELAQLGIAQERKEMRKVHLRREIAELEAYLTSIGYDLASDSGDTAGTIEIGGAATTLAELNDCRQELDTLEEE